MSSLKLNLKSNNSRLFGIILKLRVNKRMESQQAESIEVSELIAMETLEDYVQTDAKDLIVEELDTDEVH